MRIRSLLSLGLAISSVVTSLSASVAVAATPMLSKIECSGRSGEASGDRAAKITVTVESGQATYPAQAAARLQLGNDSPETLMTTLTTSQSEDDSGRVIHVFHSALDLQRSFEAHTSDLRTGVGSLRLDGPMRGPSLQCTFTLPGTLPGETARTGIPSPRPSTRR